MTPADAEELETAVRRLMAHLPHPRWDRPSRAYDAYREVKAILARLRRERKAAAR